MMAASHSFSILTCLFFALILHSSLATARMRSRGLHRRQTDPQTPPTINTTIHDPHGTDISSSFKTMIFHQKITNATLPSNLTDKRRSLDSRNDIDYSEPRSMFRTIISCKEALDINWHFVRSECDHSESVQSYTIWCRPYIREYASPRRWGHYGPPQPKRGTCTGTETCLNGPERTRQGQVAVAWCIQQSAFVELALDALGKGGRGGGIGSGVGGADDEGGRTVTDMDKGGQVSASSSSSSLLSAGTDGGWGGNEKGSEKVNENAGNGAQTQSGSGIKSDVTVFQQMQAQQVQEESIGDANDIGPPPPNKYDLDLSGATLSAVTSKIDNTTPLSIQSFDVEAGVVDPHSTNSGGLVGVDGTAVQEQSCQNCVDLEMGRFKTGTEALRTEMTVLDSSIAAAGSVGLGGVLWVALFAV